jgi:hypothetical protein
MLALVGLSCRSSQDPPPTPATSRTVAIATTTPSPPNVPNVWLGVYASPGEIGGFSGTTLVIDTDSRNELSYRKRSYSDRISENSIAQDERHGSCLAEGDTLYVPEAYGYFSDGKPRLLASIERLTRVTINGHQVLMRDDALKSFREDNKLYDYGILIKVSNASGWDVRLENVPSPSIKALYADPSKPWKDPFVHGPNSR